MTSLLLLSSFTSCAGCIAASFAGRFTRGVAWSCWLWRLAAAFLFAATSAATFLLCLRVSFPALGNVVLPGEGTAPLFMVGGGFAAAQWLVTCGHKRLRNLLLAGSISASAMSCALFLCMSEIAQPFLLAYDLTEVLATVIAATAVNCGAYWILSRSRTLGWNALAGMLLGSALLLLVAGSLAAILPFAKWQTAVQALGGVAVQPIAIIAAIESFLVLGLTSTGSVIDRQISAQSNREMMRLRQLADSAMEGLLVHRHGTIIDANGALSTLIGRPLDTLRGQPLREIIAPAFLDAVLDPALADESLRLEIEVLDHTGTSIPVEVVSRDIHYNGGPGRVLAMRDLRERREAERRIRFLAHHDALTGLANRALLLEAVAPILAAARQSGRELAVLCLDLDRFKDVNDLLGHAAGDDLLREVARRLRAMAQEGDVVARLGGDEFLVVQTVGEQPRAAEQLAECIVKSLSDPYNIAGSDVVIGSSVGIARYPQNGESFASLLQNADIALYRAKDEGRGTLCFFETEMDLRLRARRSLEQDLRQAIGTDEFTVEFQPQFRTEDTTQVVGFEALARWTSATRGKLSPVEFIPLAEETRLIVPLGQWVLQTACHAAAGWPVPCRVAVNLSPVQFRGTALPAIVAAALRRSGLPPERLELEVTENVLIRDTTHALKILHALKQLGVRIVLDDFGTGYSSLSYLQSFPFDKLKIDKSFIRLVAESERARAIVEAIMVMSRALHLTVTAEGVETTEQLAVLKRQRCDELQGFLLGGPITSQEVALLLTRGVAVSPARNLSHEAEESVPLSFSSNS